MTGCQCPRSARRIIPIVNSKSQYQSVIPNRNSTQAPHARSAHRARSARSRRSAPSFPPNRAAAGRAGLSQACRIGSTHAQAASTSSRRMNASDYRAPCPSTAAHRHPETAHRMCCRTECPGPWGSAATRPGQDPWSLSPAASPPPAATG